MTKKPSRIYLPRTTVSMGMIVTVEEYAKWKGLSFGRALELMILESVTYNDMMEELEKDAPWLYRN